MNEQLREKIVAAVEKSFKGAGAESYESGVEQARKLIGFAHERVESIKTIQDLRTALDSCPPLSKRDEMICLFVASNISGILRLALKLASKRAAKDLPAMNTGRPPALSRSQIREALDYVSKLDRSGCSPEVAQSRTAQRFGCSLRTIQRLWKDRAEYSSDSTGLEVTVQEVIEHFN